MDIHATPFGYFQSLMAGNGAMGLALLDCLTHFRRQVHLAADQITQ
jgi:hypothetical protein